MLWVKLSVGYMLQRPKGELAARTRPAFRTQLVCNYRERKIGHELASRPEIPVTPAPNGHFDNPTRCALPGNLLGFGS
jgi:hypothetical protein